MREDSHQKPSRPPTRQLSDLVVPIRPEGVSYENGEDYDAQALLTANSYDLETSQLVSLLRSDLGIFQAAAARLLGLKGVHTATRALKRLAKDSTAEETARVQAAFALARLRVPGAIELLASLLDLDPDISPAPLQAAGALARLGDPRGFPIIRQALASPNRVVAMVACKQLYAFVQLDGQLLPGGGKVEIFETFRKALERQEANITGEARVQLAELDTEQARTLLNAYRSQGF
jgi:HEAT repeat protein